MIVPSTGGRCCMATANRGWVASSGTIDDTVVRDAIVRTVNGGVEVFQSRHKKFGF